MTRTLARALRVISFLAARLTSDQGVAQKVQAVAQSGSSSVANFTIDRPGTCSFVCEQPGHAPAGMHGTIIVQ